MDPRILIVGKSLCVSPVEKALADSPFTTYLCVDDPDMADWVMRDGYDCDMLIVDRALFASLADAEVWAGENGQAFVFLTDAFDINTPAFTARLCDALRQRRLMRGYMTAMLYRHAQPPRRTPGYQAPRGGYQPPVAASAAARPAR